MNRFKWAQWPNSQFLIVTCRAQWPNGYCTVLLFEWLRFEPWLGSLCCVLGQDTLAVSLTNQVYKWVYRQTVSWANLQWMGSSNTPDHGHFVLQNSVQALTIIIIVLLYHIIDIVGHQADFTCHEVTITVYFVAMAFKTYSLRVFLFDIFLSNRQNRHFSKNSVGRVHSQKQSIFKEPVHEYFAYCRYHSVAALLAYMYSLNKCIPMSVYICRYQLQPLGGSEPHI